MVNVNNELNHFNQCKKIEIKHPLIKSIFTYEGNLRNYCGVSIVPMNCTGYNHSFSRIYLTYLTQRLFQFQRFCGFEESFLYPRDEKIKLRLASIPEEEIQEHLSELNNLYQHTQAELKKAAGGAGTVKLYRGFKSPVSSMVSLAVRRAKAKGETKATVYGNTLDFYSLDFRGFRDGASVIREVPIKNILVAHQTVKGFTNTDQDIFVVNTSPTGFFDVPLSSFKIDDDIDETAEQAFNRIADNKPDLDHHRIFSQMMLEFYPQNPDFPVFTYRRGGFELFLAKIGRRIDSLIGGNIGRWGWWR